MPPRAVDLPSLPRPGQAELDHPSAMDESPVRRFSLRTYALYGMLFVLSFVGGYLGSRLLDGETMLPAPVRDAFGGGGIVLLIGAILLSVVLVVLVHEVGHFIGGQIAGFRFRFMVVGPVRVHRTDRGLRVGWNTHTSRWGGLTNSVPYDTHRLRQRHIIVVGSGPLTSLLAGGAALALFTGLDLSAVASVGPRTGGVLLYSFGILSCVAGVGTLIPTRTGGFYSDGARLWHLWRNTPQAHREVAVAAIGAEARSGLRPRDWSAAFIEQALATRDYGYFDGSAYMRAYRWALDRGEPYEAAAYLGEALNTIDQLPLLQRDGLRLEAAYLEGLYRNDAEAARLWFDAATENPHVPPSTYHRAEAAVLLAEGKPERATEHIQQAQAALKDHGSAGIARAEADWLEVMLDASSAGQRPS